jgi:hypothetical protein
LNNVIISFRGNGIVLCKHGYTVSEWESMEQKAEKIQETIEYCWFQAGFHSMPNSDIPSNWTTASSLFFSEGLILDAKGIIEIKINGKRIAKILAPSLLQDNLLFPLYQTKIRKALSTPAYPISIAAYEGSIGLIGKLMFQLNDGFNPELLLFNIVKTEDPKYAVLESISYDEKIHQSKTHDSLITGQYLIVNKKADHQ